MARTRIAMIGLGMAATPHARSLLDLKNRVEVVAAYSPTEARRRSFAEAHGLPVSADLDAIFADRSIAAVTILTPPNTHLDLVRRAAAAGKHILLEKPLEIDIGRAEATVAAAEGAGVTLGVVFQNRFRPGSSALARLMEERRLGVTVGASARIHSWRPQAYYDEPGRGTRARDGGGVLLTQAIHTIDLLIALAGQPEEVFAYADTSVVHRMETEDVVAGVLRYGNGAMGTISATTCAFPGFAERIEIVGTRGTAVLEGGRMTAAFLDGTVLETGDEGSGGGTGADPMAFAHDQHRALIEDFLDAMETGRAPEIPGAEALKAHDLIEAILGASATGAPQRVRRR